MTTVIAEADIRGYYRALDIQLPGWTGTDASVRCFAQPDLHRRADRDPSMSINLSHGAYHCHGCGAHGGAYDAALERGHTPRGAIELMIEYGLIHRRSADPSTRPTGTTGPTRGARRRSGALRPRLADKETEIRRARRRLMDRTDVVSHLAAHRGWFPAALHSLELGLDVHNRITIPVRTPSAELVALLRYRPDGSAPKLLADRGSRRVLYPHPVTLHGETLLLVEGEPDRITAHSHGLPAIAIPGAADAWQRTWAALFRGRRVVIALDADPAGRAAAKRISADLTPHATSVISIDVAPDRGDGYDVTDWLMEHAGSDEGLIDTLASLRRSEP